MLVAPPNNQNQPDKKQRPIPFRLSAKGIRKELLVKDYNTKKKRNQEIYPMLENHVSKSTQKRFCDCGKWIDFLADEKVEKLKVNQTNFCKHRFCPMCAWRKAIKDAMKIDVMMNYIEAEHHKDFIFVTLTAPNVKAENLRAEITRYNEAFKKLCKRLEIAAINQGYVRKLEITYNAERDDYHPHFHVIFAVEPHYFKSRLYVKKSLWLDLWRECMNDYTITQVDVRRVKRGENTHDTQNKDTYEIGKYAAKDDDYGTSQEVFDVFYTALKGRQILTFNGLFAVAHKKYKADKLEDYKFVDQTIYVWLILYRWSGQEYVEKRKARFE
jgi:plasmid rolling circle replication initiator protein Rep